MKITYFINHYPKVSHTFIRNEIQGLEELGVIVDRVAIHKDGEIAENNPDFQEKNKTHYLLEVGKLKIIQTLFLVGFFSIKKFFNCFLLSLRLGWNSDTGVIKSLFYLAEGMLLASQVRKKESDHIHAHFGTNSTDIAMYASMLTDIPFSFTVHGPEEFDRPYGINLKEKIERASLVFAITKYCQSQLYRWVDYKHWAKIKIVHCGLGDIFFNREVDMIERSTNNDILQLLCIGRLCEQKGPMLLLEALPDLIKSGIPLHLTFAGDGELRSDMESFISQHQLGQHVTITGWVDSKTIRELLTSASLMVLPSFAEGLPVAIMEALALKVPVLTTHINGIPELIEDGESGLLIVPGCKNAISDGIKRFSKLSHNEVSKLTNEGFRRVKLEHSSAKESEKVKTFVGELSKC
ncbi:MAG: colanic acid biosynthesis glycosyltransferase WcaL [Blastomonas sp.]|nr:colanic acid biosynthesis glycosyltransferase WcaL [Blastomonas sp.]|tara:strand:- start:6519 stop:7742 length:1224 start_codon:yes stop_codon:yes gene_type:complete